MNKPDCYKCKHRRGCSGSAHSLCNHPSVEKNAMGEVFGILASVGRVAPLKTDGNKIKVKGNAQGIRRGWFNWPYNFDPVWLESCDGFKSKTEVQSG